MNTKNRRLILQQLDTKMTVLSPLGTIPAPGTGWIKSIRTALHMTLEQLARKLDITLQSVREIETREQQGTITLKSLKEAADALDMKLVYALVPKDKTLAEIVEDKVSKKAQEIVNRTSNSMALEEQENEKSRLMQAFEEKKNELRNEMPKYLWD
jgi:predicted DNA-binding mobile mystery protein A